MKKIILLVVLIFGVKAIFAQTKQAPLAPSPIIYIYDASGSMWGQMSGKTKMEIAASVLSTSIDDFAENQQIGLVAYGHRQKGDCRDVETLIPLTNTSKSKVASAVKAIKPLGKTPLAYSAETVIGQLRASKLKATIVLITDGIESCDGEICKVVSAAKKEGIDFKLHIVGFGLKEGETEQLKCAAKAGDGNYYDAADAGGLTEAMSDVAAQTVDKPKGNHGIYATMNGKAIDAMVTAYKAATKNKAGGIRTYRDTAYVYLPQETYDLEVAPLENSRVQAIKIENIKTSNDKKTYSIVSFDGAKIRLTTTNNGENWNCTSAIIDANGKRIAGKRTYNVVNSIEINAGTYDIKLRALRLHGLSVEHTIRNVTAKANQITEVAHNFESGTLEVLPKLNGEIIDCTSKVIEVTTGTNVGGGRTYNKGVRWIINPGTYEVTLNAIGKNKDRGSKKITVTVEKGKDVSKTIQF